MKLFTKPQPTGASPRHLDVRELHLELRRAQKTIEIAATMMSLDQASRLHKALVINKVVEDEDWLGTEARNAALNRIKPRHDWFKSILIVLCTVLSLSWCSAQTEDELQRAETAYVSVNNG